MMPPVVRPGSPHVPRIILLIETSNAFGRRVLAGIRDYVQEHRPWSFQLNEMARGVRVPNGLTRWKGEGVIARIDNPILERWLRGLQIPVVNLSASGFGLEFPTIITDSPRVAQIAAEHLLECGFMQFAFFGDARFAWSGSHERHFSQYLASKGYPCFVFPTKKSPRRSWAQEHNRLADWVRELPKPVGIMACYDFRGAELLAACREVGVAVPEEVGVIGHYNDEAICEFCDPPLSSVIPNARMIGYLAATLLDQMLQGESVPPGVYSVPPVGVMARGSTDVVAIADADVAAAVRFIRAHACEPIDVGDLLREVPVSRSLLERKFKRLLGISPHEMILRLRLRKAQRLLVETDLGIERIAALCGFSSAEYMSYVFRRHFQQCPRDFRRSRRRLSAAELQSGRGPVSYHSP
jgi:LacI family transcriptional regulator